MGRIGGADNTWREYRRPQLRRDAWQNLNGLWHLRDRVYRKRGVCAAVYTQATNVEGEVNGLLTYDGRVEKLSRAWLARVQRPLQSDRRDQ